MKATSDLKFYNSKRSPQQDQENRDPNTYLKRPTPSSIKRVMTSGDMWSSSNAGEHCNTTEDVETSCFNLGPQKVSVIPHTLQLQASAQLDGFVAQRNIQDALLYLEEFEDIDWVKNSQVLALLEAISRGDASQIQPHTLAFTQILTTKQFLLSKQIIKTLFNTAFREGAEFAYRVDQLLEEYILNSGSNFHSHQVAFLPLILYSHSQHLLQSGRATECWELLQAKLDTRRRCADLPLEEWDKTVQKVCEMLLRNVIAKSQQAICEQILYLGIKPLTTRPNDIFFNKLIDFSFKNKQVQMAESLFRFMTKELGISPTIVTINTLIDQYFKNNHPENAWLVFEQLKTLYTQIKPDNFTYTTLINGLKSNRDGMDLRRAFTLFEEYKLNSQPDQIIYNCLLDACINAGDLDRAYRLLDEMKANPNIQLDEITYNTLIKGCGRKKRLNDAISLFEEMKQRNITPNRISFNSLLDSCVKCNKMNIAWKYYEEMTKSFKIAPDNFTYSILVNGIKTNHSNRDELLKAIQLLEEIQEDGSFKADEILYNSLIDACVKFNEINKSLSLFEEMKRKHIEPSSVTYGILIKAYGKQNELTKAFKIFEEMKQKRVNVNDVTYGCLVDACVKNDRLDAALNLIEQMKRTNVPLNTVLYTTLIKGFAKANQIQEALDTFAMMKLTPRTHPNLITYNSLMDGLVKADRLQDADQLFHEMLLSESMSPDLITFSTLLKGCCRKGDVEKAKEVVNCMGRMGIQPDESLLQMISDLLNHSKTPRTQQRDQFVEQFGRIVQNCGKEDNVLKDVSNKRRSQPNDENKNYGNQAKPMKENYNQNQRPSQRNNNNSKRYQNDLEEYVPRKSNGAEWRPSKKH